MRIASANRQTVPHETGREGRRLRYSHEGAGGAMTGGRMRVLIRYLAGLTAGRLILWCYFIWYVVVLVRYFDASPRLWLTSLGLSLIIGLALFISTARAGASRVKLEPWQVIRLFLMPFCVSSFSALVKGRGFVLIFSPNPVGILAALGWCGLLCLAVAWLKHRARPGTNSPAHD